MDIFFIFIEYLKNMMLKMMNIRFVDGIFFEKDIDFVLIVLVIWGDEVKLFMWEVVMQVRCLVM